jgi:hypothetical protein
MPITFPSHPGLILPLWSRYPRRIDAVALSVGALAPDLVDASGYFFNGTLGQWIGHSLAGLVLFCVPIGLLLTMLARRIGRGRAWLSRLEEGAPEGLTAPQRQVRAAIGVLAGGLSHIFFDFISHGNFLLFYPWHEDPRWFPELWYHRWGEVPIPLYRTPFAIAPHSLVWGVLSILGIVLFVRVLRRPVAPVAGASTTPAR